MKRYNITSSKPDISDGEIEAFRNFDELLATAKIQVDIQKGREGGSGFTVKGVIVAGIFLIALLMITWYFEQQSSDKKVEPSASVEDSVPAKDENIEVTSDVDVSQDETNEVVVKLNDEPAVVTKKAPQDISHEKKNEPVSPEKNAVTEVIDEYEYNEAVPLAGIDDLYNYFDTELQYPSEAVADSVNGVMLVSFIINTEGKPEQIEIIRSLGAPFDAEAVRVINNMPLWRPATVNGKPINSKINIPLTFHINR